jgi:hypothetical protein
LLAVAVAVKVSVVVVLVLEGTAPQFLANHQAEELQPNQL